jgi:hypothetical protein
MTPIRLLAASFSLAAAGVAHAGDSGAGPAGSAGTGVGSIITPGSHALLGTQPKDDQSDRVTPGNGGALVLQGEQLTRTAEALRGFAGAQAEGDMVRAPTVLADGTPAMIALNTRTGLLSVSRLER